MRRDRTKSISLLYSAAVYFLCSLLFLVAITTTKIARADTMEPMAADEIRKYDPNHTDVEDERLASLYLDTTIAVRKIMGPYSLNLLNSAFSADVFEQIDHFRMSQIESADVECIISNMSSALEGDKPDWNLYRVCLWAARGGAQGNHRIVPLMRRALRMPRPARMSNAQVLAIKDTLGELAWIATEPAIELLYEATTREFWGADPFIWEFNPRNSEFGVGQIRGHAIWSSLQLPYERAEAFLESMERDYDGTYVGDEMLDTKLGDKWTFEERAMATIRQARGSLNRRHDHGLVRVRGYPLAPSAP